MFQKIGSLFRFYIDLPLIIVVLILLSFVHRPILNPLFDLLDMADTVLQLPPWIDQLGIAIIASVISAFIIALPVFIVVNRWSVAAAVCGKYNAFNVKADGTEESWGTVTLKYNLLSKKIRGRIVHGDVEIALEGVLDRDQYLRGHYVEDKKIHRRRLGAFLLLLDGDGDGFKGPYVYVDPEGNDIKPKKGDVRWARKS